MILGSGHSIKITLGVSGGIACYKSAELVRLFTERGHAVQVVMTDNAQKFISPLTFAALTGKKVITGLFSEASGEAVLDSAIEHIGIAQQTEVLVIAPATANVLARFANGLSDDFLTTTYLAYSGPVVVAPAMNTVMWDHPATRKNIATLRERGVRVVEPGSGSLACGMTGPGRLAELESIVAAVEEIANPLRDLAGETVLITAGPTQEAVDPVRFLTNRSSGKMGYALAAEAQSRGARVILVSGPVAIEPPVGCEIVRVATAEEMRNAVVDALPDASIVVMAAAVADFRPVAPPTSKIKKRDAGLSITLEPTPDILLEVGRVKGNRFVIGFAAETDDLHKNALQKLTAKNCDMIVANPVGPTAGGLGFDSAENRGWLFSVAGDPVELPQMSKREMAARIFDRALAQRATLTRTRA
jgi:phosphopantothenoylcysteine decarboxylase/phosphopantothenate--cysteine ligase